ncbi:ferric reductase [Modestobacter sp. I12A-02628]|uniref:Ferric reductase n=1 Tax=Goekera deserti TaxID=2497753 RepID=A0A7K3W936_9ACTN|nr:ferric reductase-like transmembrane domain-containing protein [Goekera deserti]MPQ98672.1 ferric reductase [Goekera deserti]NDI49234.1 ferric reductase [Goekera deserti]NEL52972.1 ferric reductase [Goekera deserti]
MSDSSLLWYLNRSTGLVLLLTMTLTIVLGVAVQRQARLPGLPRFGVVGLHRSVALLSAVLLAVHVVTAVVDGYVDVGPVDAVVPYISGYRTPWVGLGTIALDLVLLVVGTSLLRGRLPAGLWRAVHLTSYLLWPIAFLHGLGTGTDLGSGWALVPAVGCAVAVLAASAVALGSRLRTLPAAERARAALAASSPVAGGTPVGTFRNG